MAGEGRSKEGTVNMAKVQDGGQAGFEDGPLMNREVADACEAMIEHREAAKEYRKAVDRLKKALPGVDAATRFIVGESYFITVNPYDVDSHSVAGGHRQRIRVMDQSGS